MLLKNKLLFLLLLSSISLRANANAISSSQAKAVQSMHEAGENQSDWGQVKNIECSEESSNGETYFYSCIGEYRSLGPGGGGSFWFVYQCGIPVHDLGYQHYQVIDSEVMCQ